MAPITPSWFVNDLSSILGLDDETIKQMIIPDLESYTHEARLRVHLQDFLGPSQQAKSFITRYISFKFPSLSSTSGHNPSSISSQSLTPDPSLLKPTKNANTSSGGQKSKSPLNLSRPTSNAGSSRSKTPNIVLNSSANPKTNAAKDIPQALEEAFGPGGRVYQKKNLDGLGWGGVRSNPSQTQSQTPRSGGGSGTQTPNTTNAIPIQGRVRQAGAVNIQIQEPKRLDTPISASGSGSRTNSSKGKNREEKIWDVPKSKEVKKLEKLKENLRILKEGDGKIKEEGLSCFCQARVHPLSPYTPICQSCGLTLCNLQIPYLPCPSCFNPLSTPAQISRLILRIEGEIELQLNKEERERQQVEKERLERLAIQSGGGSFPTLPGQVAQQQITTNAPGGRKVISIGSKVKGKTKITTTTYTTPTPSQAGSGRRPNTPPPENIIPKFRTHPIDPNKIEKELNKLISWRNENDRPWGDLKLEKKNDGSLLKYKELAVVHILNENSIGRRKKGKAAKKLGEGGREVPGSGV